VYKLWSSEVWRGHNTENYIYIENIFFSITSRSISTKLGTNHTWVKKKCSKEGSGSFLRGTKYINAKKKGGTIYFFFSRARKPEELIYKNDF
jgi:hypothetical protein